MNLFDVIEYTSENQFIVYKHPTVNFNTSSILIVREGQEAVFVNNGKYSDLFGPGRYKIKTDIIPILKRVNNFFSSGKSSFISEVYFINKVVSFNIKWGTSNTFTINDPVYNVLLEIGASGSFAIRIDNSRKFLARIIGTSTVFEPNIISTLFRGLLISNIKDSISRAITEQKISFIGIHSHLLKLSNSIQKDLADVFDDYGIVVNHLAIENIVVPENDPSMQKIKDAIAKKAEMDILGYNYQQGRSFDVLESAAKNEGIAGNMVGSGLGLGVGLSMGTKAGQLMQENVQQAGNETCSQCGTSYKSGARFCPNCGKDLMKSNKIICANCHCELVDGAKFCPNCGQKCEQAAVTCSKCGTSVPAGTKFCFNCGEKI